MKDTKHIRWDFILSPGSCPRSGTLGHWGAQGVNYFFKYVHVANQIDGDDEQNRIQVTFSSYSQLGDLGRGHKVKYH